MRYNKDKAISYLQSLYNSKKGFFDYSKTCKGTILSTDFAVSTLNLLGEENFLSKNKKEIKDYLLSNKGLNDLFIDRKFDLENFGQGVHKKDYIIDQFTYFSLMALDILGVRFSNLDFFNKFLDVKYTESWFSKIDWDYFWYESNRIMFVMYFYAYLEKYGNNEVSQKAAECIEKCFDILNEKQNPKTGYWGNYPDMKHNCFGAAHIYMFYGYFKKDIRYVDRIIDSTLKFHCNNGLAINEEGGACEDYNLIEIYLRALKQTDYKKDEIFEKLRLMKKKINRSQNRDGGFSYRFYRPKNLFERIKNYKPEKKYNYSSWELMETSVYNSDLWGTYFRMLSLAAIDFILEDKRKYKSYNLPGWGYIYE